MKRTLFLKRWAGIAAALVIAASSAVAYAAPRKVLVLYDEGKDRREPALNDAKYLANLLGHFPVDVRLAPVNTYRPGAMDRADAVFYINFEKKFNLPAAFKNDFYRYRRTFCWLNHQIGGLDQEYLKRNFGFHFLQYRDDLGFDRVDYKGVTFPKGDENVDMVAVDDPSLCRVVSWARNGAGNLVPYILQAKNFWFVADSPFSYATERDRYIAFADLLHDILGIDHPVRRRALVRIEDINPLTEPKSLLRVAKFLHSKHIPFAVGLVPVYIDPAARTEIHLEDRPRLLAALRDIPGLGGTFVLHGYTHQYHGTTTDDYEFWDDIADKPVRGDSLENVSLRIEKGLKECFGNGLYPVAWETPHYFASQNTYLAVKQHFTAVFERRGTMDHLGTDQFFPYEVRDLYGQLVIPENLGYVPIDRPDARPVIDAARLNLAVRDGYASFFFHTFIDISCLKKIVTSLREMGYEFQDIRDFSPSVTAHDKALLTAGGRVRVETHDRFIFLREFDRRGRAVRATVQPNDGKPAVLDVSVAPGNMAVVEPEEELEPGIITKIWRLAKTDLRYFRAAKGEKERRKLNDVQKTAFIAPVVFPRDAAEAHDLQSLRFSLTAAGVRYREIPVKDIARSDLREYDIIVVPFAAAKGLKDEEIGRIREAVNSGSGIVFDGPSKLTEVMNITLAEESVKVQRARDTQFPDIPLFWPAAAEVRPVYKSSEDEYRVLCVEENSNTPLVVSGKYGNGTFVYFSTFFDPHTDRGYSRFPFLLETLEAAFSYQPLAERAAAEMYFDPGTRQYISVEKLARLWRAHGVRTIYAGGWHFYDKYTYDYARLIRVCHQNGILVYCWLEPPMVSQKFWNKYPQWHEKTALLKDASTTWRSLMNLADPECRAKALAETEALLMKYDWDGVNLAELCFESAAGPELPDQFTPMNARVRADFRKKGGFDPIDLFNPSSPRYWRTNEAAWKAFAAYRLALCNRIKDDYVAAIDGVQKKKKDMELIMTVLDTSLAPLLREYLAEDMDHTLVLRKKYDFTLQVEDAASFWSGKPERYAQLGEYYRRFVKDPSRLQLDCNVLDNHRKGLGGLPAEKPTGEEMRQIAYNMSLSGARPVFYSEASLYENDFHNITAALSRDAAVTADTESQWRVVSPSMVTVRAGRKDLIAHLNGEPWFAGEGESVIVPAGEHTLKFEAEPRYFDMTSLKPRLSYISGELKWANFFNNAIEFSYDAGPAACYAVISKRPSRILVDDVKISCPVFESDAGFSVKLPSGAHVARVNVGGGLAYIVETSGVVLFSLVIIFGFFASVAFIGMFILIQLKRKLQL